MKSLPKIVEYHGSKVFYVDGKPYLGLAGEVHNSSCSNVKSCWQPEKRESGSYYCGLDCGKTACQRK